MALKLLARIRKEVDKNSNLSEICDALHEEDNAERTEFEIYYHGVSNGFIAELINAVTGYEVEVLDNTEELFSCPCCGYKTLTELYDIDEGTGYEICPYCNWEDDGTTELNVYSSVNKGTIEDYHIKMKQNENKFYINKWK